MAEAKDELSLVFHALADPTRRAILSRLHSGPTTVGELAEPFSMSRPAISQHLKVLERAGLIERTTTAQWRTCTLRTEPLDGPVTELDDFGEVVARVDVHDRKRQTGRPECLHGEAEEARRILPAGEEQHGPLALGDRFAQDVDGLRLERPQVSELIR